MCLCGGFYLSDKTKEIKTIDQSKGLHFIIFRLGDGRQKNVSYIVFIPHARGTA